PASLAEIAAAYPYGLDKLRNIERARAAIPSGTIAGIDAPYPVVRQRLARALPWQANPGWPAPPAGVQLADLGSLAAAVRTPVIRVIGQCRARARRTPRMGRLRILLHSRSFHSAFPQNGPTRSVAAQDTALGAGSMAP